MNALALMATLGLDSTDYEKGLDDAKSGADAFGKNVKKILAGLAIGAAVKKTVDGIVDITKAAVNAYKDFQQLEGGVQTLFGNGGKTFEEYAENAASSMYKLGQRGEDVKKLQEELINAGYDIGDSMADGIYGPKTQKAFEEYAKAGGRMVREAYENSSKAQELVMENADKAFMTAGLSANQYMETVTGFSASLIQSLGGDTMKAAELSDVAIRDMSDNANKMGSDMQSLQTAYAGFAKQNYTMLDNLKLGYGGTKTEMERLIADANKLREAQGLNADLTIEKYSDVIEAIHTVQENMGITGTTAQEAQITIEGSLKSTKAAWENLLTAMGKGDGIKNAIRNLVNSAKNVVTNVMPIVKNALQGLGELVTEIAPIIAEELPGIITDLIPPLITAIGTLVAAVIDNLPQILSALWTAIQSALSTIWNSLVDQYPILGEIAEKVIGFFTEAWDKIKEYWEKAKEFFSDLWTSIQNNETLMGLIDNIKNVFVNAWEAIKNVWELAKTFFSGIWKLITGEASLGEVFESLKEPFIKAWDSITKLWEGVVSFFVGLWNAIINNETIKGILDFFKTLFEDAWNAIVNVWNGIVDFFTGLWDAITNNSIINGILGFFSKLFQDAWNAVDAAWNGIVSFFTGLWDSITNNPIINGILDFFTKLFEDAWNAVDAAWNGIIDFFVGLWNSITDNPIINGILDFFTKLFEDAWAAVDAAWNGIVSFFTGLWDSITNNQIIKDIAGFLGGLFTGAWDAIKEAWKGAADWFSDIFSAIWEKVKYWWDKIMGPINDAINAVKDFLGLNQQANSVNTNYGGQFGGGRSGGGGSFQGSGGGRLHASAMDEGEILSGLTPFAMDRRGTVHYGGEAGDEAVVGVSSLRQMVGEAALNALKNVNVQLVLSNGVLVAELAPLLDEELNNIASWKGGGRAQ